MARFSKNLFVGADEDIIASLAFGDEEELPYLVNLSSAASMLNALVFRVSRKPTDLTAHVRRIYFCYQNAQVEPLYAALLDLLIILDNRGRDLTRRLILGSRSVLNAEQFSNLYSFRGETGQVRENRFCLFTKGLTGSAHLVEVVRKVQVQHDYLGLARDFIEFSQLDEAIAILEQGLEATPSRQDLQTLLLELYQSTQCRERFQKFHERIRASGAPLNNGWQTLAVLFNGNIS